MTLNLFFRSLFACLLLFAAIATVIHHGKQLSIQQAQLSSEEMDNPFSMQKSLPDFTQYQDVKAKKRDFFLFLLPKIRENNQRLSHQRQQLLAMPESQFSELQIQQLAQWSATYKIKSDDAKQQRQQLLKHMDIIPPSLVLAQAANESAWGTSRFARQGNNLFGQWCYKKGCGIVPSLRGKGENHEVARFATVADSVASYMRNLNSQFSYEKLRSIRQQLRLQNKVISGHKLAEGLINYSTRREAYIHEIQAMIRQNQLAQYDRR